MSIAKHPIIENEAIVAADLERKLTGFGYSIAGVSSKG